MNETRRIYLDHAATTYLDPRVVSAMQPYWEDIFGNPSSLYREGRLAKQALNEARESIAQILHCQSNEIIFTGSGTEANNLAILGVCKAWEELESTHLSSSQQETHTGQDMTKKPHLITSAIEHHAVLNVFRQLERQGYEVTYLPVGSDGIVAAESVEAALRPNTLLVSIMYANNEIGTIQPIQDIAALCRQKQVIFHTDACQAAGALSLDTQELAVDLLTINASKIYGPKGVGALYIRQGTRIKPLVYGGGQEKNLRSGTENLPGIVGLAKALQLIEAEKSRENRRLTQLRDYCIAELGRKFPDFQLNGHRSQRLPNNINFSLPGVEGEAAMLLLDEAGIACSVGSACDSANIEPSHVITALGASAEAANSAIRLTLGKRTTRDDIDYVVVQLGRIVERLQSIVTTL